MPVKLTKVPLNRWGKPLRTGDSITASCLLDQHIGYEPKRGKFGWIEPCTGIATRLGTWRHCACNCHRDHAAIVSQD